MEMMQNAVNWIEIPAGDFDRAKKFYSAIYDYDMPVMDMGPVKMGMLMSEQPGVGGAIVHGDGNLPNQGGTRVYLNGGNDLSTVLDRVEAAGGKVIAPKTEIGMDMGYYAFFEDSEGNKVGLHSMQ